MKRLGVGSLVAVGITALAVSYRTVNAGDGASEPVTIKKYPWQVAINIDKEDESYRCAGAVISQRWVLTAAHCFDTSDDPANLTISVMIDATSFPKDGVWSAIERIVAHPNYKAGVREDDLALIKLKVAQKGHAVPLPGPGLSIPDNEPLELVGWGITHSTDSGSLHKTTIKYTSPAICNDSRNFDGRMTDAMFCAGGRGGGVDSCQVERGGPLIWRTRDGPVLVGVASWNEGCSRKLNYEVFTRVSAFRKWIDSTIADEGK